jgi:hypothetical protein
MKKILLEHIYIRERERERERVVKSETRHLQPRNPMITFILLIIN